MFDIQIKEHALEMLQTAYNWYEDQVAGLGDKFIMDADHVFSKLCLHPEHYTTLQSNFRQVKLTSFPYVIVYEISGSDVIVFAVFHTSRNPEFKFKQ